MCCRDRDKARLAHVWHSQFFPRALWPAAEFCSRISFRFTTVEDSISFLSSKFIHMTTLLGLGSDPPLALSPALPQSPVFFTRPLLSAGNSSFFCSDLRNSVASSLSHAAACFPTSMLPTGVQPRGVVVFQWSWGSARLSFVVPAKTWRDTSLNRAGSSHSKCAGTAGNVFASMCVLGGDLFPGCRFPFLSSFLFPSLPLLFLLFSPFFCIKGFPSSPFLHLRGREERMRQWSLLSYQLCDFVGRRDCH